MREKIIELIKEGKSIPRISKELMLNKSTIYYHYKKIKGKKKISDKIPKNDKIIGEFLGIFAGDGNYYYEKKRGHHTIRIFFHIKDDIKYSEYVKELIEKNFNKKVMVCKEKKKNLLTIKLYSKNISEFIKNNLEIYPKKTYNVRIKDL